MTVQHLEQVWMSNFQVKILDAMQDIYYGRVASPWALDVDDWSIDPHQVIFDQHKSFETQILPLVAMSEIQDIMCNVHVCYMLPSPPGEVM